MCVAPRVVVVCFVVCLICLLFSVRVVWVPSLSLITLVQKRGHELSSYTGMEVQYTQGHQHVAEIVADTFTPTTTTTTMFEDVGIKDIRTSGSRPQLWDLPVVC